MNPFQKIVQWVNEPKRFLNGLLLKLSPIMPDKLFLSFMVRLQCGYWPNWKDPQTFSEKIQWLKLYNRNPKYTIMVDKYAVKDYVAELIGEEYVIPTLGVWDRPEDIEWDKLPEKFVLKTTHGGGNTGVVICKDKSTFDKQKAVKKLNKGLKQDIYITLREWPYKNVPRRILAEKLIESESGDLPDYKFFCFDGVVKALFVGSERETGDVKFDFFDADFNHLDLVQSHPMSGRKLEKPVGFEEMKLLATKLSKGIPHVRVDLYNVRGKIYFGELTFFHHGGVTPFHPQKWDYTFGSWITLPQKCQ
jgi:hypothetical protein